MTTEAAGHDGVRLDPLSVLEDSGYRICTEPRRSVVRLLNEKADGFTAEEISDELPNVGRATVYRTIKILHGVGGRMQAGDAGRGTAVQHGEGGASSSYGVREVREYREFKHVTIERLLRAIGREVSGEIVGHRIEVFINCEECGSD